MLKDSTLPDHTRDLKPGPAEDPTIPMDAAHAEVTTINPDDGRVDKTNHGEEDTEENAEWKDNKSDEPANLTPTYEDGGAANTTKEEID
jgi:hypothetical protein